MNPPEPQQQLAERAIAGEQAALVALLNEHGPLVRYGLSDKLSPQWQSQLDVDDVMQVTYLEAFLRIATFQFRGEGSFRAWLSQIARNNLQDAIRGLESAKRQPPGQRIGENTGQDSSAMLLDELLQTTSTPSRHLAADEVRDVIRSAVEQLPADYAEVVERYDLRGQTAAEVATALGRSAGAIFMLRARALDRLREVLMSEARLFG